MSSLHKVELSEVDKLAKIAKNIDSPDLQTMYSAGQSLAESGITQSLLPKAMSLLTAPDVFIRKLVFRIVGQNAFGKYIESLFTQMKGINPAEREQVLQAIEERFMLYGAPVSKEERSRWIEALETLGKEHQPTVIGLISYFEDAGIRWFRRKIKQQLLDITVGSLPKIKSFPSAAQPKILKLLIKHAVDDRRDFLPFLSEIVDANTVQYLSPFLRTSDWKERALVAEAVSRVGITSSRGYIMEIVADPNWQVKKKLLEGLNLASSKFSAVLKILGYVLADSRTSLRQIAERVLLRLGSEVCLNSKLGTQRRLIEKKYREQLLKAASKNRDVDSKWLGVIPEDIDIIPVIDEEEEAVVEGISLSDLDTSASAASSPTSSLDLMSALLSAKKRTASEDDGTMISQITKSDNEELSMEEQFISILKTLSKADGKNVKLNRLKKRALQEGFSEADFEDVLDQLEREGTIYRSSKGTIGYVDIDL